MRLGGVIFACVGIIIVVLVANGRWSSVWAAMLNNPGTATPSTSSTTPPTSTAPTISPIPGYNYGWTDAPTIL